MLGHPEWRDDARFATNSGAHGEPARRCVDTMNGVLRTRTRAEWIGAFDAAGVPAGPVHSIGEALTHPQTLARGMVVDLVHPEAGAPRRSAARSTFPTRRPASTRPAPLLGEHTREVLREAGYDDAEIAEFIAAGVVAASRSATGAGGDSPTVK